MYNTSQPKILFAGYGDIAARVTQCFLDNERRVAITGLARSPKPVPDQITLRQGDLSLANTAEAIADEYRQGKGYDCIIVTLTPDERSEEGYRKAYFEPVQALLRALENIEDVSTLKRVIFISSTSVYQQSDDQWVDENTTVDPDSYSGRVLLETEILLQESELPTTIVRFSGIYGESRDHIVKSVKKGNLGSTAYTNRIRVEDCAGILHFLSEQVFEKDDIADLYLASDCEPTTSRFMREWISDRLGMAMNEIETEDESSRRNSSSKRCSNQRLLALGYRFLYPTYREGYDYLNKP